MKIPITNSKGESTKDDILELLREGIKVNVTAVLSYEQIDSCINNFSHNNYGYISIFAGRISDTGRDSKTFIEYTARKINEKNLKNVEIIWASTREIFNVYEAAYSKCHITVSYTHLTLPTIE